MIARMYTPKPQIGRPGIRITDEVVDAICERITAGESITRICQDADMPSKDRVYVKMASDEAFRTKIARAREAQQDALIDETHEMAEAATAEDWQVVKLRIWARQWRAGKLAPRKYGDRQTLEHTGANGGPIAIAHVEELDDAQLARIAAEAAK